MPHFLILRVGYCKYVVVPSHYLFPTSFQATGIGVCVAFRANSVFVYITREQPVLGLPFTFHTTNIKIKIPRSLHKTLEDEKIRKE